MRWMMMAAGAAALGACATAPERPIVEANTACAPQRFDIYFDEGQAGLTQAARDAVSARAQLLQGCEIRAVRVIGLADATGAAAANQSLSERRATTVAQALANAGWPTPAFEVEAAGDQGALTSTGAETPMRRRTEVLVDAGPR